MLPNVPICYVDSKSSFSSSATRETLPQFTCTKIHTHTMVSWPQIYMCQYFLCGGLHDQRETFFFACRTHINHMKLLSSLQIPFSKWLQPQDHIGDFIMYELDKSHCSSACVTAINSNQETIVEPFYQILSDNLLGLLRNY